MARAILAALACLALAACDKPEVRCERARKRAHDEWTRVVTRTKDQLRKNDPRENPDIAERLLTVLEGAERARDRATSTPFVAHEAAATAASMIGSDSPVEFEAARAASEDAWELCGTPAKK